jgi:hypothetical protein
MMADFITLCADRVVLAPCESVPFASNECQSKPVTLALIMPDPVSGIVADVRAVAAFVSGRQTSREMHPALIM